MERNSETRNRSGNGQSSRQSEPNRSWNAYSDDPSSRGQEDFRNDYSSRSDSDYDNEYGYGDYGRNRNDDDYGLRSGSVRYRDTYREGNSSRNWWDKTKDEVSGWFGDESAQHRRDRDQQFEHRGKGPKGYTRSDDRITEDVNERLTEEGSLDAGEIEVDVKNGDVFLKGTVRSRQEKRKAEDIVESVSGVKNVENHIKVDSQGSGNTFNSQYTTGLRERKGGLEYGPGAVSGMANSSSTGDFNTAK